MCVLGQPEPVGSVLTFPSGYDTLEYSWMKATAVSVRLRILFVTLQNTNKQDAILSWKLAALFMLYPQLTTCVYATGICVCEPIASTRTFVLTVMRVTTEKQQYVQ